MTAIVRKSSLFRDGHDQAVRIPKEFELPGTEVTIKKENGRLIVEAGRAETLIEVLDRLEPIDEEWPEIDDPLPESVNL